MSITIDSERYYDDYKEEVAYYDMLHEISRVFERLNKAASNGVSRKAIQKKIISLIPAFTTLCGVALSGTGKKPVKESEPEPKKEKVQEEIQKAPAEPLQERPKLRTVLNNNLKVKNGWGICPVCGTRCIKTNRHTILVNFPMFCKRCKLEHIVTWRYDLEKEKERKAGGPETCPLTGPKSVTSSVTSRI